VPCGARQSGPALKLAAARLKHKGRKAPASPTLLGGAAGAPKSKAKNVAWHRLALLLSLTYPPVGDAEKRSDNGSCPGPMSEAHVLCGPSLGPGPLARASQGSRAATVTFGSPFLGPASTKGSPRRGLAKAKEGTRSPQGSETASSRERNNSRSVETSKWIPACAGMTAHAAPAARRGDEIASSASPPRNDATRRYAGNPLPERVASHFP